jgi:hypothetical protein
MAADLRRIPGGAGPLDECPAGARVASCGDAALVAAFATGVRTGGEIQRAHELSGFLSTAQVAELGDEGDSHGELDATHSLESLDDGGQPPPLDLLPEFGLKALEPFLMFRQGADVLLEDHLVRGRGTDHFCQPAQVGRPPGGTALRPNILPQQEGLQPGSPALRSRIVSSRARLRSRIASSSTAGTSTGVRSPERRSRASWVASRRSVLTRSAHLLRDQRGGHDPAEQCLLGEITIKPVVVDKDKLVRFRGELAD